MRLWIIALSCFLTCYATEARSPTPSVQPTPGRDLVCRTKQQDAELRDWIIGIQNQATAAIKDAEAANKSNEENKRLLELSKQDADTFARQCQAALECYKAPLSCWFHRFVRHLFWVIGSIIVLVVVLAVASIFVPALAPILNLLKRFWDMIFKRKTP
jgi:hypothetical protein